MENRLKAKGITPDGLMPAVYLVKNQAPFHPACILVHRERPY